MSTIETTRSPSPTRRWVSIGLGVTRSQPNESIRSAATICPARAATIIPVTPILGAETRVAVTKIAPISPPRSCHHSTFFTRARFPSRVTRTRTTSAAVPTRKEMSDDSNVPTSLLSAALIGAWHAMIAPETTIITTTIPIAST